MLACGLRGGLTMNPAITNEQYDDLMAIIAGPVVSLPATPRPMVRKSRHFYRCEDCLTVAAVDTKLACKRDKWGYVPTPNELRSR